jgi:hypothetical protein
VNYDTYVLVVHEENEAILKPAQEAEGKAANASQDEADKILNSAGYKLGQELKKVSCWVEKLMSAIFRKKTK